jgi:hypothetical protein
MTPLPFQSDGITTDAEMEGVFQQPASRLLKKTRISSAGHFSTEISEGHGAFFVPALFKPAFAILIRPLCRPLFDQFRQSD